MSQHLWVNFQQIKRQVRIEQVVKAYGVSLHRVGSELRGACPLPTHSSEKSRDSFSINTARNIWCCQSASCMNTREGKIGGTVIDLVAIMENCSMREAALRLQDRYATPAVSVTNNPLPPSDESHAMNPPLRFTLRDIATSYPYLAQRGVRKETAEIFGVGYYSGPGLQHGRIVIPVQNARQELVAYAGRAIDGQEPKYLLPPGFRKSLELFNLCRARNAESRTVIVVEGFFDTMAVHQAGHRNVVGLMGSSLSSAQADLLQTHFDRVILMLDGDDAGRRATDTIARRLAAHLDVQVISLRDGQQPDQLASEEINCLMETHARNEGSPER